MRSIIKPQINISPMVHRHFEDVSNSLTCTSRPCRWKVDVGRLAGEQAARYYNPRTMDLNPEQQPSPSQRSSMSFSRWGWSETWKGTWAMSYINIYSSKGTRTPGYARCQFTSRYQVSYALCVWKIDFKNVCLPSIQVLVFKCHFPIKGTKIHGEMADCMTGQRKYKMTLKILWCQKAKECANRETTKPHGGFMSKKNDETMSREKRLIHP